MGVELPGCGMLYYRPNLTVVQSFEPKELMEKVLYHVSRPFSIIQCFIMVTNHVS